MSNLHKNVYFITIKEIIETQKNLKKYHLNYEYPPSRMFCFLYLQECN